MAANTIILKGQGIHKEGKAAAALTPGMLVERTSTGTIQKHGTADGFAVTAFALENEIIGKGIDSAYAENDRVLYSVLHAGEEVNALIASGQNIAIDARLVSAGDGTLKGASIGTSTLEGAVVAVALEAVNNSSGPGNARIRVEVK